MGAPSAKANTPETKYPHANALIAQLHDEAENIFDPLVTWLTEKKGDGFWTLAERFSGYSIAMGGNASRSLIEYTIAYLREQALYLSSKEYSNSSFDVVREAVYDNPEVMQGFYLEGLMLTHAFWPVHYDIHSLFMKEFVPLVPAGSLGTEFGYGHGLYILEVLSHRKGSKVHGFDISKYSKDFASRLFALGGIESNRYSLDFADVRTKFPAKNSEFSWAVFAEVLEHIPDPKFSLSELRRTLTKGAPVFLTTVLESNALDHIYCFKNAAQVREMIEATGFKIVVQREFAVKEYGSLKDPSTDLVFICLAD